MRQPGAFITIAICSALAVSACTGDTGDSPTTEPTAEPTATEPTGPDEEPPTTPEEQGQDDQSPEVSLAEVALPAQTWEPDDQPRQEDAEPGQWRWPQACPAGIPQAQQMLTVTHGEGELEAPVGVQQVALFEDSDEAVDELDRVRQALDTCMEHAAGQEESAGLYVVEDLEVGAQGIGLAVDYNGVSADGDLDSAIGSYVAMTRRGNAVTLVGYDGGESTVGTAREEITGRLAQAWELLCSFDSEGC